MASFCKSKNIVKNNEVNGVNTNFKNIKLT